MYIYELKQLHIIQKCIKLTFAQEPEEITNTNKQITKFVSPKGSKVGREYTLAYTVLFKKEYFTKYLGCCLMGQLYEFIRQKLYMNFTALTMAGNLRKNDNFEPIQTCWP